MAEYRGLTIRINADTSRFSAAMRATQSSIAAAQKEMRSLKKSMEIDPQGSSKAASLYMKSLQTQATAAATKMTLLRSEMSSIGSTLSKSDSSSRLGTLAKNTDDAVISTRRAKAGYEDLTRALAEVYTNISRLSHASFDMKSDDVKDLQKSLGNLGLKSKEVKQLLSGSFDDARAKLMALAREGKLTLAQVETLSSKIKAYQSQGITINDANDNTDIMSIATELQRLIDAQKLSEEEGIKTIQTIMKLKDAFNEASDAYDDAKMVEQLRKDQVEVANLEAKVRAAAQAMIESSKSPLAANVAEATTKFSHLSAEAKAASDKLKALTEAVKLNPTNIDLVKQRSVALREAVQATQEKAEGLKRVLDTYKTAGVDRVAAQTKNLSQATADAKKRWEDALVSVSKTEGKLERVRTKLSELQRDNKGGTNVFQSLTQYAERLENELKELKDKAKEAGGAFHTLDDAMKLRDTETQLQNVNNDLEELRKNSQDAADSMATSFYQALQQVGQFSKQMLQEVVTATYDLEDAFTNVRKTVNASEDQFQKLKDNAISASLVSPVSADQILNVEALGGQLGFTVTELEEFQRVANGLDISTNMDWEQAATNMAQFFNIMGTGHDEVGRYGSAIVDLGNNFATTESAISDMAMRIAGAGATLGLSEADVLGIATALTSMGLSAEAGGSSVSQIMLKIEKAVAQGTKGIQQYADDAGMSVKDFISYVDNLDDDALNDLAGHYEMTADAFKKATVGMSEQLELWAETAGYDSAAAFAKAWEDSPVEALQAIFHGLDPDKLEDDGSNLSLLLEDLGIKTIRQGDVARRLANSSDLLTRSVRAANDAWEENAALDTEVERRNESLSGRMDTLSNILTAIKTEVGEGLQPVVEGLIGVTSFFVKLLDMIPNGFKTAAIGIAGFLTVAGLAGSAIGAIAIAIPKFMASLSLAAATSKIAAGTVAAFDVMLHPITALKLGAIGLVGALTPLTLGLTAVGAAAAMMGLDFYKSWKQTHDFEKSISGFKSTMDGFAESMHVGASDVDYFNGTIRHMSVKDVTNDLEELASKIKGITDPVNDSNMLLGEYQTILDELWGKGKDNVSDDEVAMLEWALDGLNSTLETTIEVEDVLNGKYEDQEGRIYDNVEALDALIQKQQEGARAAAAKEVMTELYKEQFKLTNELKKAEQDYQNAIDERRAAMEAGGIDTSNISDDEIAHGRYSTDWIKGKESEVQALQEGLDTVNEELDSTRKAYVDMYKGAYDEIQEIIDFVNASPFDWASTLESNGQDVGEFAAKLYDAGIKIGDLQQIYDDHSVWLKDFVNEAGGDWDELIRIINEYKESHPSVEAESDTEEAKSDIEELGEDLEEIDNTEVEADVKVNDEASETLDNNKEKMDEVDGSTATETIDANDQASEKMDNVQAKKQEVEGSTTLTLGAETTSAMGAIGSILKAVKGVPVKWTTTFHADTGAAHLSVSSLKDAIEMMPRTHTTVVNVVVEDTSLSNLERRINSLNHRTITLHTENAGTHADGGFIANKPTWISSHDVVGEAGAEAIIPLTNRRYAKPFADLIASDMSNKLDSGTNITVNLNYTAGDDANAMARDLARSLGRIMDTRR